MITSFEKEMSTIDNTKILLLCKKSLATHLNKTIFKKNLEEINDSVDIVNMKGENKNYNLSLEKELETSLYFNTNNRWGDIYCQHFDIVINIEKNIIEKHRFVDLRYVTKEEEQKLIKDILLISNDNKKSKKYDLLLKK